MRYITTAWLLVAGGIPFVAPAAGTGRAAPTAELAAQAEPIGTPLTGLCACFSGAESLQPIEKALRNGESPNSADAHGDTPLLLLCRSLEYDYRYRTEPHFAKALDQAFILLLSNKADALRENADGCNTIFYLHGQPPLLKMLEEQKLLPRELAVRIPYDEAALLRYMHLRVAQEKFARNDESHAYLVRRYCAPAYSRAEKLLDKYLRAEMRRRIPPSAVEDTLAFLRLADCRAAEEKVNALPLWEHGEHFLEEVPEHLLQTLDMLGWNVAPELLEHALDKLDSMLPRTATDMIDCNAGYPMAILLGMRARHRDAQLPALLERFARSRDSRLAYTALSLQLQERNLPLPDPETLASIFQAEGGSAENLPEVQRRLLECAIVDSAIRNCELSRLKPDMVRRTRQTLEDMGMPEHAAILAGMTDEEGLTVGEESLQNIATEYTQLHSPAPQVTLARYILEHPDLFRAPAP